MEKPSATRSHDDIEILVSLISTIDFFNERDIADSDFPEIVSCMTYEHMEAGSTVFEYGN